MQAKQVAAPQRLQLSTQELAQVLNLPAWIFQPSMMQQGSFKQPLPQGGLHQATLQVHQAPQDLHPPQLPTDVYQGGAWPVDLDSMLADVILPPEQQAGHLLAPHAEQPPEAALGQFPAGLAEQLPVATQGQFIAGLAGQFAAAPQGRFPAPQAGQLPAGLAGHTAPYPDDSSGYESPSSNGNRCGQQAQHGLGLWPDECAAQGNMTGAGEGLYAAGPSMLPPAFPGDSQDLSRHNAPISPEVQMPYTALTPTWPAPLGRTASPANSSQSMLPSTVMQQTRSPGGIQHPHPQPAPGMSQNYQAAGQELLAAGQGLQPDMYESVVFRGRLTQPSGGGRGFTHSQSERVRLQPLSRTHSFAAGPGTAVTEDSFCSSTCAQCLCAATYAPLHMAVKGSSM